MSPLFVKNFKSENACPNCPKSGAYSKGERSLCERHLTVARLEWRIWAILRRRAGLCIECHRGAKAGTGRCPKHRERNRAKCRRWMSEPANRQRNQANELTRKQRWATTQTCRCAFHDPVVPGLVVCRYCQLDRKEVLDAAERAELRRLRAERRARLKAKQDEVIAANRRALAELGYVAVRTAKHSRDGYAVKSRVAS